MMEKRAPLIVSQPKSQPAKRKPCLQLFQTKGGVGRKKPLPISFSPTLICLGHALPPSLSNSSRHIRSFLFLFLRLRGAPACRGKKGKKGERERERNPIRSTSLRFVRRSVLFVRSLVVIIIKRVGMVVVIAE